MKELVYKYLEEVDGYHKTMARFGFENRTTDQSPNLYNHPGPLHNQNSYQLFYLKKEGDKLKAVASVSDKKLEYELDSIFIIDIMEQDKGVRIISGMVDNYNNPMIYGSRIHFDVVSKKETLEDLFSVDLV